MWEPMALFALQEHNHVKITINTNAEIKACTEDFFVHEILHGMGLFSVIAQVWNSQSNQINQSKLQEEYFGMFSSLDHLITTENGQKLITTSQNYTLSANGNLTMSKLYVHSNQLYNPPVMKSTQSLSHFDNPLSSMAISPPTSYANSQTQCMTMLTLDVLDTLKSIGWFCNNLYYTQPHNSHCELCVQMGHHSHTNGCHHHDEKDLSDSGLLIVAVFSFVFVVFLGYFVFAHLVNVFATIPA